MTTERISAFITYSIALLMGWLGKWDLQDVATVLGMVLGIGMFLVSWYYRRKTFQLLVSGKISRGEYESANR
ncbi:phage holin family protein [Erwiniaceae bacterium BAC15a-03b]|uniref:Phage holin family protein n=1 Tax=Winslowiella arboricola TaxID=2978220 RepID=A0A9J6PN34_9GAMM|nr:HP1 family phage holin [Winslowiella arboricola]MCU5773078.1 phage holin family protein [Winslowiella arboricola]MCU5777827.1 phage holin family protein [Winslowiella arboricola]